MFFVLLIMSLLSMCIKQKYYILVTLVDFKLNFPRYFFHEMKRTRNTGFRHRTMNGLGEP